MSRWEVLATLLLILLGAAIDVAIVLWLCDTAVRLWRKRRHK